MRCRSALGGDLSCERRALKWGCSYSCARAGEGRLVTPLYATPGTVQEWVDTFGGLPDRDEHSVIADLDAMREQAEEREQEDSDEQRT